MMDDTWAPLDDKAILQQAANLNAEVLRLLVYSNKCMIK